MIYIAMMSRTDEPMEGVVFDVQDHARRTGTRGLVHMGRWLAQTSMGLKSHQVAAGMAEAGQSCDEPLHREEEGRPHQDVLAET